MKSHQPGKAQDPKVTVSSDTLKKLKTRKDKLGLKSMDALLAHLLSPPSESGEEVSSSVGEDEARGAPPRKRKKNVREPLFSFEELINRHEMLEYYTGLDKCAFELLVKRLGEVRTVVSFFPPCGTRFRRMFLWFILIHYDR